MTDSMKILQIPIPAEAIDALGLKQSGRCSVTITDGKIIIEKEEETGDCIMGDDSPECCDCPFSCPNCGECIADICFKLLEDYNEERGDEVD